MPAVLRGLLGSPLADRHDLVAIATHRPGGVRTRTSIFAHALVAFVRWSLRAPPGPAHVHVTVRGSMYRKTLVAGLAVALRRDFILHVHAGAIELETFHARLGPARRTALRWAFRAAARVLAVSRASGQVLERHYGAPTVEILPNVVEQVAQVPASPPDPHRPPRILFLGGFANPVKGGLVLVEALPALWAACPGARLDLAGPGEPPVALAADEHEVRWLGWLDVSAKRAALAGADLFVLPSTSEGLPVALLEAMAHGKGIVATRVGGVPEVMEHGRQGILVPPGDPAALAHALGELAGDPERARSLGASARERVAELAPERIAERLDALYLEVMARGGSR
jgi:glycosyltransferase involved in cell wall biosynthesis